MPLLGTFAVMFDLGQEMSGIDLAWVSDPIDPQGSYVGPQHEVVAGRIL